MAEYVIGLDFGTASARGVLLDAVTGEEVAEHVHDYAHGTFSTALPDGTSLPRGWALQIPDDYLEAAEAILAGIGKGRRVPWHWRWLHREFAHAMHVRRRAAAKTTSRRTARLCEAVEARRKSTSGGSPECRRGATGWTISAAGFRANGCWQRPPRSPTNLPPSGRRPENSSSLAIGWFGSWQAPRRAASALAAYKAQYREGHGYPPVDIPGLGTRLSPPLAIGSAAGVLTPDWQSRTGIIGPCALAVAVIDSHVVLPAVGATSRGTFVAALGTSAVSMFLDDSPCALPAGIEGAALGGAIPGLWCYEAGQASFGDMLTWFVETFPKGNSLAASFSAYEAEARDIRPWREPIDCTGLVERQSCAECQFQSHRAHCRIEHAVHGRGHLPCLDGVLVLRHATGTRHLFRGRL